jgi:hypothetical protein
MKIKVLLKNYNSETNTYLQTQPHFSHLTNNNLLEQNIIVPSPKTKSSRFSNIPVNEGDLVIDVDLKGSIETDYLTIKSKIYNLNSPGIRNESTKISSRVNSPIMTSVSRGSLNILDLKASLSSKMKVKLDMIEFFDFANKNTRIKDSQDLKNYLGTFSAGSNFLVFYYKLGIKTIVVEVDYFQNNIDKIIFELNLECSIYMLKNLIVKKLQMEETSVSEFLIYFSNSGEVRGQNKSSDLSEDLSLRDILRLNGLNENLKLMNLLLIRKGRKRYSVGLDLSFTFMRNLRKINFDETAPSYHEVSDGMNIFFYCTNFKCNLYEDFFTINYGYQHFDIIGEIKNAKCPRCKGRAPGNIEARSIGFINSEWNYKGLLSNKNSSLVSGDGITIDNKLYVIKETNIISQFLKLEITVKENNIKLKRLKTIDQHPGDSGDENFDDIDVDLFPYNYTQNNNAITEPYQTQPIINNENDNIIKLQSKSKVWSLKSPNSNNLDEIDMSDEIKMESKNHTCCLGGTQKNYKEKEKSKCCIF